MRNALALGVAGLLAACASEKPPEVSAEAVEAAVEHAHLELERATAPTPARASERVR
ncbi:MAG TPA: hypothetical protein VF548_06470 [Allosphingosinicella sp.]|jgi:hypothetical protein